MQKKKNEREREERKINVLSRGREPLVQFHDNGQVNQSIPSEEKRFPKELLNNASRTVDILALTVTLFTFYLFHLR